VWINDLSFEFDREVIVVREFECARGFRQNGIVIVCMVIYHGEDVGETGSFRGWRNYSCARSGDSDVSCLDRDATGHAVLDGVFRGATILARLIAFCNWMVGRLAVRARPLVFWGWQRTVPHSMTSPAASIALYVWAVSADVAKFITVIAFRVGAVGRDMANLPTAAA
jgi:hypothetical protein